MLSHILAAGAPASMLCEHRPPDLVRCRRCQALFRRTMHLRVRNGGGQPASASALAAAPTFGFFWACASHHFKEGQHPLGLS